MTARVRATSVEIVIPGQPVPCPRPRISTQGSLLAFPRKAYYPARYVRWKDDAQWVIRDACVKQLGGAPLWRSSVSVVAEFFGASDTADIDNLLKSVLDALQGVVIENDRQVKSVAAFRQPACGPGKAFNDKKTVVRVIMLDPLESFDTAAPAQDARRRGNGSNG